MAYALPMQEENLAIIGLGSNKGDRTAYLRQAVAMLREVLGDMRLSRVLESRAVLPEGAPAAWDVPYLNMAVAGSASLPPLALLGELKALEDRMGRVKRGHWGPREIDMDILAMGDTMMTEEALAIPHAELLNRDFALLPLADVAPDWRYPAGEYKGWLPAAIAAHKGYRLNDHLKDTGILLYAPR